MILGSVGVKRKFYICFKINLFTHSQGLVRCHHKNLLHNPLLQFKWNHGTFSFFAMQHKLSHAICLGKYLDHLSHCGTHWNHSDLTICNYPVVVIMYKQWPPCWLWIGCKYIQSNVNALMYSWDLVHHEPGHNWIVLLFLIKFFGENLSWEDNPPKLGKIFSFSADSLAKYL